MTLIPQLTIITAVSVAAALMFSPNIGIATFAVLFFFWEA